MMKRWLITIFAAVFTCSLLIMAVNSPIKINNTEEMSTCNPFDPEDSFVMEHYILMEKLHTNLELVVSIPTNIGLKADDAREIIRFNKTMIKVWEKELKRCPEPGQKAIIARYLENMKFVQQKFQEFLEKTII